jgi:uncharacterized protein
MADKGKIILGTVQLGINYGINNSFGKPDEAAAINILETAYNNGIRLLDTAQNYGDAERIIGEYHKRYPEHHFDIITKFSLQGNAVSAVLNLDYITNHLQVLGTSKLYGCLFHNFENYLNFKNWSVFSELAAAGIVANVGVSVYTNDQIEVVSKDPRIQIVQLPFNLLDNFSQRGKYIRLLKDNSKEVHTRSVFLQGLFFKNRSGLNKLTPLKKELLRIDEIAAELNIHINALAIGYVLSQPLIDKVLIGVETEQQLVDNLSLLNTLRLIPPSAYAAVDKILVNQPELLNPVNW